MTSDLASEVIQSWKIKFQKWLFLIFKVELQAKAMESIEAMEATEAILLRPLNLTLLRAERATFTEK